jgi:hypothetical protein
MGGRDVRSWGGTYREKPRGILLVSCLALSLARISRSERVLWSALYRRRLFLVDFVWMDRADLDADEEDEVDEVMEEEDEFRRAHREIACSTTAAKAPSLPETEYLEEEDDEVPDAEDSGRGGGCRTDITPGETWSSGSPL